MLCASVHKINVWFHTQKKDHNKDFDIKTFISPPPIIMHINNNNN